MNSSSVHLSALVQDALALSSLAADEDARAREHLSTCARCRDDAETLEAARERFERFVLARTSPLVQERARRPFWRRASAPWVLVPVLAVATLAVWVARTRPALQETEPELGIKGPASLQVVAERDERVFPVRDGSELAPGDRIRFVVLPGGLPYLLIASVDSTGQTTIYYPYDGAHSGRLAPIPRIELPGSIVLDQAPGPERIYALFTHEPIAASTVRRLLSALGARGPAAIRREYRLDLSVQQQISLLFEKAVP